MESVNQDNHEPVVAVIGGGFSGTMVTVQLARICGARQPRILLFEKGERFARGVAYGTRCDEHLLNVPAGMMSALPDEPTHFIDWLKTRDSDAQPGSFAPRRVYGEYLGSLLGETAQSQPQRVQLIRDEVTDVSAESTDGKLSLTTLRGERVDVDRLVLALGHPTSRAAHSIKVCSSSRRYVANPWKGNALDGMEPDDSVVLIGAGLTAIDLIVEARAKGHIGPILALSRHGLRPQAHRPSPTRPHFSITTGSPTARSLLRRVRAEVASCHGEGGDWRSVVDSIRPVAQTLWKSLDGSERERFVRHVAPQWDVHRHRVAPQIAEILETAEREGQLLFAAGRALSFEERENEVVVTICRRGAGTTETLTAKRVINCTGPSRDIRVDPAPILASLMMRGLARPGPLALGLDAAPHGALLDHDGRESSRMFVLGPLLKEGLWESTAVRELREQARDLARLIHASCETASP